MWTFSKKNDHNFKCAIVSNSIWQRQPHPFGLVFMNFVSLQFEDDITIIKAHFIGMKSKTLLIWWAVKGALVYVGLHEIHIGLTKKKI